MFKKFLKKIREEFKGETIPLGTMSDGSVITFTFGNDNQGNAEEATGIREMPQNRVPRNNDYEKHMEMLKRIDLPTRKKVQGARPYGRAFRKRFRIAMQARGLSPAAFVSMLPAFSSVTIEEVLEYMNEKGRSSNGPSYHDIFDYPVVLECDPSWLVGVAGSPDRILPFPSADKG